MKNTMFHDLLWEVPPGNTIRLRSFTGDQWYSISLDNRTCTYAKFIKTHEICKHLNSLSTADRGHSLQEVTPRSPKHYPGCGSRFD